MTDPREIRIEDYNYNLPDERIAKYPVAVRDTSKLLIYNKGDVSHTQFYNIADFLPEGSLMVFNNTRVIQARLHFHKTSGALIEIFCLEPHLPHDYEQMFQATGSCQWSCLIGNRKKWKEGLLERPLTIKGQSVTLYAEVKSEEPTSYTVEFKWSGSGITFAEILEAAGELPIPPYLNRNTEESDNTTYQTIYSRIKGSVAAPTAGLHFTERVFGEIDRKGIERDEITLHVGAGTFKPVKSDTIGKHEMHKEFISVSLESIEKLIAHGGRCIAVGTTSVRTLESLYYIGAMLESNPEAEESELAVSQWFPYEYERQATNHISVIESLDNIRRYLKKNKLRALTTNTQIIIAPGYKYHIVNAMITNFHQPKSTLLLLVSAFIGNNWRKVYDYALGNGFRFLSYGDSSLLIP